MSLDPEKLAPLIQFLDQPATGFATIGSPVLFGAFLGVVIALLALDLLVFHRKAHAVRLREAVMMTCFWISLAIGFNVWVYFRFGADRALEFFTGYIVEYSLSIDNLFVFILLFRHFAVPAAVQHRVLFWGIIGALVTRGAFIVGGTALIQRFHWVIYVFGAFLLFTGIKLLFAKDEEGEVKQNPIVKLARKIFRMSDDYDGDRFVTRIRGRIHATPLLLVLIAVESTDIVFAVDSIPAIFGITTDPFIVFTSNIFAILGLRSLYFVLSGFMKKFRYLNIGLGLVLAFIGAKMVAGHWVKIPVWLSLIVVAGLISLSIVFSLFKKPDKVDDDPPKE